MGIKNKNKNTTDNLTNNNTGSIGNINKPNLNNILFDLNTVDMNNNFICTTDINESLINNNGDNVMNNIANYPIIDFREYAIKKLNENKNSKNNKNLKSKNNGKNNLNDNVLDKFDLDTIYTGAKKYKDQITNVERSKENTFDADYYMNLVEEDLQDSTRLQYYGLDSTYSQVKSYKNKVMYNLTNTVENLDKNEINNQYKEKIMNYIAGEKTLENNDFDPSYSETIRCKNDIFYNTTNVKNTSNAVEVNYNNQVSYKLSKLSEMNDNTEMDRI